MQRLDPETAAYLAGLVDGFAYKITNRLALGLLVQLAPHLKTYRAKRARMAIDHYVAVTPRNGKYREDMLRKWGEFERAFLSLGPGPQARRP